MARLHSALGSAISGLSVEQLACRRGDKWSVSEILEHLNLTYLGTIKNLERRLAEGNPTASGRDALSLRRIVVTRLGFFPPGRKSPERVVPHGAPAAQVTAEILRNLSRMDAVISRCEHEFPAGKAVADHPVLGPLTVTEWRGFHLTHGLHHIKQIQALTKTLLLQH